MCRCQPTVAGNSRSWRPVDSRQSDQNNITRNVRWGKVLTLVSMMCCNMTVQRWLTSANWADADLSAICPFFTNVFNSSMSTWWCWILTDRLCTLALTTSSLKPMSDMQQVEQVCCAILLRDKVACVTWQADKLFYELRKQFPGEKPSLFIVDFSLCRWAVIHLHTYEL